MAVDQNGGSAPSTPLLAEKQQGPAHFADLISSLQATEQDYEPRISVSLTSQPQSGGPASSVDLTSSDPAANEACELPVNITSHFQVTVPSGGEVPSASSFRTPEQPRSAVKLASPFPLPMRSGEPAPSAYVTSSFQAGCGPMDLDTFMTTELDKEMMDPTASSTASERSDPCSKPHLRTSSSFELPDMLKSADTVMEENRSLWTLSSVGKLAICLARQSFFGDSVLMSSTVTRKDRPALDPAKMASLYGVIQKNVFKSNISARV